MSILIYTYFDVFIDMVYEIRNNNFKYIFAVSMIMYVYEETIKNKINNNYK
jgi:hypothetical protein